MHITKISSVDEDRCFENYFKISVKETGYIRLKSK